jgi:two-component system response regulator MprA
VTDRPRLLVVDDDVELCESLADALTDAGYEPVTAADGLRALLLSRDELAPRLILLDLMMPDMSGWEFRELQLRDEQMKHIPVVVMTASRDLRHHPVQATAFLFKPFTLEELLEQVQRVVSPAESSGAPGRY